MHDTSSHGHVHLTDHEPVFTKTADCIVRSQPLDPERKGYCISDITSCDMLLLCLSIEVPACINICLVVMLAVSLA